MNEARLCDKSKAGYVQSLTQDIGQAHPEN